jgi:hypothetical protein
LVFVRRPATSRTTVPFEGGDGQQRDHLHIAHTAVSGVGVGAAPRRPATDLPVGRCGFDALTQRLCEIEIDQAGRTSVPPSRPARAS